MAGIYAKRIWQPYFNSTTLVAPVSLRYGRLSHMISFSQTNLSDLLLALSIKREHLSQIQAKFTSRDTLFGSGREHEQRLELVFPVSAGSSTWGEFSSVTACVGRMWDVCVWYSLAQTQRWLFVWVIREGRKIKIQQQGFPSERNK